MVVIVPRRSWGADPLECKMPPLELPVDTVVRFQQTDTDVCESKRDCKVIMRLIQKQHREKCFRDIAFNFLVGMDGNVYEGTGWHHQGTKIAEHPELDGNIITIAHIGDWKDFIPPYNMSIAIKKLIRYGIGKEYISRNPRRATVLWASNRLEYDDEWYP